MHRFHRLFRTIRQPYRVLFRAVMHRDGFALVLAAYFFRDHDFPARVETGGCTGAERPARLGMVQAPPLSFQPDQVTRSRTSRTLVCPTTRDRRGRRPGRRAEDIPVTKGGVELQKRIRDQRQRLLLALARRGNEDAFKQLYRELFPTVTRYIRIRIRNPEDAEDLCSDVFQKFLAGLDQFDPSRGSVMTWVVCLARNAVIDEYRRKRPTFRELETVSGPLAAILPDTRPSALHALIGNEEMRRVRRALTRQPSELQEMFSLRFEQGMRVREVAQVMGLSPDAVKQRFARAFRALRQELAETEKPRRVEESCANTD